MLEIKNIVTEGKNASGGFIRLLVTAEERIIVVYWYVLIQITQTGKH